MTEKKILAVCLSVSPPMYIKAMWTANELVMDVPKPLPEKRRLMEKELIPAVEDAAAKNYEILISETSNFITARAGVRVQLSDNAVSGKPVLVDAMGVFDELNRQGAITFPKAGKGKFDLPSSIFDEDRDNKGNAVYRIDWTAISSEHVLTLLCCYATMFHNAGSAGFLQKMFAYSEATKPPDIFDPLRALAKHEYNPDGPRSELRTLRGKRRIL